MNTKSEPIMSLTHGRLLPHGVAIGAANPKTTFQSYEIETSTGHNQTLSIISESYAISQ
jgi:hypothetical protein